MNINLEFEEMLDNAYKLIYNNSVQKLILPKLDIEIEPTRLHWKNTKEYLILLNRNPDHFLQFLQNEIPDKMINWFSNKKADGILFSGKFKKYYNLTDIIYKYIDLFVICYSCKNINTTIVKDQFFCNNCGFHKFIIE